MASIGAKACCVAGGARQRGLDRFGNLAREPRQDALAGVLAQRHGFQRRLDHVLGPAEGVGQGDVAHGRAGARGGQRKGHRVGGVEAGQRLDGGQAGGVAGVLVAQPFQQGAAHLLGLQAQLAAFARVQHPVVERAHPRQVAGLPGGHGLRQHGQVGARQRQVQLIGQPVGRFAFSSNK
jgi:hypothetical protein